MFFSEGQVSPAVSSKNKQWNNTQLKHFSSSFITSSLLWFVLTLLIFFRITQSNHFPLANFYEALIFLTWCLVTLNLIILLEPNKKTGSMDFAIGHGLKSKKGVLALLPFFQIRLWPVTSFHEEQSVQKQVSRAILAPCILFIIAFAQFHLSSEIIPLVPALKSNWLLMHVSIMICSYTTFIIGGLLSVILLMQTIFSGSVTSFFRKSEGMAWKDKLQATAFWNKNQITSMNHSPWFQQNTPKLQWSTPSSLSYISSEVELKDTQNQTANRLWPTSIQQSNWGFPSFESVLEGPSKMQKKNFYIILDNLSYRMMGIGFPLFTLGILSGAVWANEAWGSYWSWDIKEVGSFINWLLVALYFHCRYKNFISLSHVVAFISLMVLFFNFFGISLGIFGSSLHAYGASS